MRTGDRRRRLAALLGAVGAVLLLAGCDEIEDPQVLVDLESSSETIRGTTPVQIFATVTEDGNPLSGTSVMFSTNRGTFTAGGASATGTTDEVGLTAETLTLSDGSDTTPVEISATSSTELSTFTATLTLPVEAGTGR